MMQEDMQEHRQEQTAGNDIPPLLGYFVSDPAGWTQQCLTAV